MKREDREVHHLSICPMLVSPRNFQGRSLLVMIVRCFGLHGQYFMFLMISLIHFLLYLEILRATCNKISCSPCSVFQFDSISHNHIQFLIQSPSSESESEYCASSPFSPVCAAPQSRSPSLSASSSSSSSSLLCPIRSTSFKP